MARYAVLVATYQAGGLSLPDDFELSSLDERVAMLLGHESTAASQQPAPQSWSSTSPRCFVNTSSRSTRTLRRKNGGTSAVQPIVCSTRDMKTLFVASERTITTASGRTYRGTSVGLVRDAWTGAAVVGGG